MGEVLGESVQKGHGVMKRPSSANGLPSLSEPPQRQRERAPGDEVTVANMTKRERKKYDDAMMMSENNEQLSLMVVS